jgi:hypothetical protein
VPSWGVKAWGSIDALDTATLRWSTETYPLLNHQELAQQIDQLEDESRSRLI